jgi:glycosyltransferase involved in cell wall biosynthesis
MIQSTSFPPEEGIGNYVYGLSTHLQKKGHDITIFTRGSFSHVQKEIFNNLRIIRVQFLPVYPFYIHLHGIFLNRVFKKMEDEFDFVHIHSPLCPVVNTTLPMISTIHTPMLVDTKIRYEESGDIHSKIEQVMGRYISYRIEKKLIHRSDEITTVAQSVSQELLSYGLKKGRIKVMGNGVDDQLYYPNTNNSDSPYILYSGRLDYRKGLFDLIDSCKKICTVHPEVFVYITGKGILLDKLKNRVKHNGLQDNFRFLGFVSRERLVELYQHATVYVIPSHYEGLPTVLLEAMACGCPIVATSVSGNLDVLTSGHDGLLIPPKSPDNMADAVIRLLDDPNLRKKLGINAYNTIKKRFTWDIITNKFLEIYHSLL